MIHLNQNEEVAVQGMVERSHMMKQTLSNDDITFFNVNYDNARSEDPARLAAISQKIKEIMKIDVEGAEILRNVYVREYNEAQAELTSMHADANMTGLRKLFNSGKRKRARAKSAEITDKQTLLAQRKEFDGMYDESLRDVCTTYEVISRNSLLYSGEKTKMDRMITNLHYYRNVHARSAEQSEDESKLNFLKNDMSSMPTLNKLTYYSDMDRDYKDASANFRAVYSSEITTDWILKDIVGYTCKMDDVDHSVDGCIDHARNLQLIHNEKTYTDELGEAMYAEMKFLGTQRFDLDRWKNQNAELFDQNATDGHIALMNYTVLMRAIKKLQISKNAVDEIKHSVGYAQMQSWNREEFEKETATYIYAMNAYVLALISQADSHYKVLHGIQPNEEKAPNWAETVKRAEKEAIAK